MVWISQREGSAADFERPAEENAAPSTGAAPRAVTRTDVQRISQKLVGRWVKDQAQSDRMDEAASLMQLNWVTRKAVRLINGLEIAISEDVFTLTVLSVIPWFKVVESYPMNGSEKKHRRRDLRLGDVRGNLVLSAQDDSAELTLHWGKPISGSETSSFVLHNDKLTVTSKLDLDENKGSCMYTLVYNRVV
ncbi:hypothetical protein CYMTET_42956 [Cymbomonas tetramitiformis]|uniref:Uncharacterized protein n=1 Tax=Cymbomonas tetramitiformis TaxID=36881 RepID=A0AAE0F0H6_9CHLO|nr:hypothetical protein CYMTET_42956 [Cymbomonas tetramitiformis]